MTNGAILILGLVIALSLWRLDLVERRLAALERARQIEAGDG